MVTEAANFLHLMRYSKTLNRHFYKLNNSLGSLEFPENHSNKKKYILPLHLQQKKSNLSIDSREPGHTRLHLTTIAYRKPVDASR